MSVFIIGGTGFIGHRLVRLLVARGHAVTCMDINLSAHSFADLGAKVTSVRGDVTQFDDVMAAMAKAKPERVVNLSYFLGSEHAPHVAMKLNILGMDNCFEAARLLGVKHTMYASSLAVNGKQTHYGSRPVTEDDRVNGEYQYAKHKIVNEWQAQDYTEKFGMLITGIRPANVTGPDKVRGSVDHVNVITEPSRGNAITFRSRTPCVARSTWTTSRRFLRACCSPRNPPTASTIPAALPSAWGRSPTSSVPTCPMPGSSLIRRPAARRPAATT